MRGFALGFVVVLVGAIALEIAGLWWLMPVAGALGGYAIKRGGRGFLAGGLGVTAAWGGFLAMFAATSPVAALLRLFARIMELGDGLAFMPVVLALIVAFLLGGLGGLSGSLMARLEGQPAQA